MAYGDPWRPRPSSILLLPMALWCIDRMRRPLTACGLDFRALRSTVEVKLSLDLRDTVRKGNGGFQLGWALMLTGFWLAGMMPGVAAFFIEDTALWIAASQGLSMAMLFLVLTSHFATMLVDHTDVSVLGPLPISGRTMFAARLVHVAVYVGALAGVHMTWPLFLGCFSHPPLAVLAIYPLLTALSSLFALSLVGLTYSACLRLFGPRNFQRVTFWIQVLGAAASLGGFQLVFRLIPYEVLQGLIEEPPAWLPVVPPFSFGHLYEVLTGNWPDSTAVWVGAGSALILPVLALWTTVRLATRHFANALEGAFAFGPRARAGWSPSWLAQLGHRVTKSREELAGYQMGLAMSRRESLFVRSTYAQLIGFAAMGFGMSFIRGLSGTLADTMAVFGIYMVVFVFPGMAEMVQYGSQPESRWVYHLVPEAQRKRVLIGALKALGLGTAVPAVVVLSALFLAVRGWGLWVDLSVAWAVGAFMFFAIVRRLQLQIPFSRGFEMNAGNVANLPVVFGALISAGLLFAAHVGLRVAHPLAPLILVAVLVPWTVREARRLPDLRLIPTALE